MLLRLIGEQKFRRSNSLVSRHRTVALCSICSQEWQFQAIKVPWTTSSRERKFQGTKVYTEWKFHEATLPQLERSVGNAMAYNGASVCHHSHCAVVCHLIVVIYCPPHRSDTVRKSTGQCQFSNNYTFYGMVSVSSTG